MPHNPKPKTHQHTGKLCPVTGHGHGFCPAQEGDSRSACPALNSLANHGYIARDGKNLAASDIIQGLKECYRLSAPLAYFLTYAGFTLLRKVGKRIALYEISKHGLVEHNASLVHHDTPEGQTYAPVEIDLGLADALYADVQPGVKEIEARSSSGVQGELRFLMNDEDVARARIRRERECGPISAFQQEIARGEMAIILGVWEVKTRRKTGIPMEYFQVWIEEERLPDGWRPDHTQGLLDVIKRSRGINKLMQKLREGSAEDREAKL
ncbi:Cloroperoxidase [Agrocybe pediades]|nr:Cloroperoxidase [Agrocybe pediades]